MNINNSARLSYRLMTADDAELLYQLDQDPEVMRFRKTLYRIWFRINTTATNYMNDHIALKLEFGAVKMS